MGNRNTIVIEITLSRNRAVVRRTIPGHIWYVRDVGPTDHAIVKHPVVADTQGIRCVCVCVCAYVVEYVGGDCASGKLGSCVQCMCM